MKRILALVTSLFFIFSCSQYAKKNIVHDGDISFQGPDYPIAEDSIKPQSRGLASVSDGKVAQNKKSKIRSTTLLSYNNKMIYFLTLYSQFLSFKKITNSNSEIQLCPSFHSVLVSNKDGLASVEKGAYQTLSPLPELNESIVKYFPQLHLPAGPEGQHPSVWEIGQNNSTDLKEQLVGQSLKLHTQKIYTELRELCEYGVSDNYYIFENLVVHIQDHGPFKFEKSALESLLKTSIFSNMYLLHALAVKEQNHFEKEVLGRLEAEWLTDYFNEVGKKRQAFYK